MQACQAQSRGDLALAARLYRQLVTEEPQHVKRSIDWAVSPTRRVDQLSHKSTSWIACNNYQVMQEAHLHGLDTTASPDLQRLVFEREQHFADLQNRLTALAYQWQTAIPEPALVPALQALEQQSKVHIPLTRIEMHLFVAQAISQTHLTDTRDAESLAKASNTLRHEMRVIHGKGQPKWAEAMASK